MATFATFSWRTQQGTYPWHCHRKWPRAILKFVFWPAASPWVTPTASWLAPQAPPSSSALPTPFSFALPPSFAPPFLSASSTTPQSPFPYCSSPPSGWQFFAVPFPITFSIPISPSVIFPVSFNRLPRLFAFMIEQPIRSLSVQTWTPRCPASSSPTPIKS